MWSTFNSFVTKAILPGLPAAKRPLGLNDFPFVYQSFGSLGESLNLRNFCNTNQFFQGLLRTVQILIFLIFWPPDLFLDLSPLRQGAEETQSETQSRPELTWELQPSLLEGTMLLLFSHIPFDFFPVSDPHQNLHLKSELWSRSLWGPGHHWNNTCRGLYFLTRGILNSYPRY